MRQAAQEHHREGSLPRRAAAADAAGHVRHQRRRARDRLAAAPLAGRGVRGDHPPQRAAAVLGAHHPVPRLVGRVHPRHPRRGLRPHRQEEEVPGHRAAARVRVLRATPTSCGCSSPRRSSTSPAEPPRRAAQRRGDPRHPAGRPTWPNPEEPKGEPLAKEGDELTLETLQPCCGAREVARVSVFAGYTAVDLRDEDELPQTTRRARADARARRSTSPTRGPARCWPRRGKELSETLHQAAAQGRRATSVDVFLPSGPRRVAADQEHARQGPDRTPRRRRWSRSIRCCGPARRPTSRRRAQALERLFFSPKRYDLGRVGRYKINQRLGRQPAAPATRCSRRRTSSPSSATSSSCTRAAATPTTSTTSATAASARWAS